MIGTISSSPSQSHRSLDSADPSIINCISRAWTRFDIGLVLVILDTLYMYCNNSDHGALRTTVRRPDITDCMESVQQPQPRRKLFKLQTFIFTATFILISVLLSFWLKQPTRSSLADLIFQASDSHNMTHGKYTVG